MRRAVADGVKICTGLSAPSKIGPKAAEPVAVFSQLKAILAASNVGKISKFAAPFKVLNG